MWHVANGEGARSVPSLCDMDEGIPRIVFNREPLQRSCWRGLARGRSAGMCGGPSTCLERSGSARQRGGMCWGRGWWPSLSTHYYRLELGSLGCCGAFWARWETKATSVPHQEGFHGTRPDGAASALAAWPSSSRHTATHGLFNPSRLPRPLVPFPPFA